MDRRPLLRTQVDADRVRPGVRDVPGLSAREVAVSRLLAGPWMVTEAERDLARQMARGAAAMIPTSSRGDNLTPLRNGVAPVAISATTTLAQADMLLTRDERAAREREQQIATEVQQIMGWPDMGDPDQWNLVDGGPPTASSLAPPPDEPGAVLAWALAVDPRGEDGRVQAAVHQALVPPTREVVVEAGRTTGGVQPTRGTFDVITLPAPGDQSNQVVATRQGSTPGGADSGDGLILGSVDARVNRPGHALTAPGAIHYEHAEELC